MIGMREAGLLGDVGEADGPRTRARRRGCRCERAAPAQRTAQSGERARTRAGHWPSRPVTWEPLGDLELALRFLGAAQLLQQLREQVVRGRLFGSYSMARRSMPSAVAG